MMNPSLTGSIFGLFHHFLFQWPYQKSVVLAIVAFLLASTANAAFEFKALWLGTNANSIEIVIGVLLFSLSYVRLHSFPNVRYSRP